MKYDFYNREVFYKPGFTVMARDRLHRIIFQGLNVSSVLEVGIGFGELADYCRRHAIGWVGVDANQRLIDDLKKQGFKAYFGVLPQFPVIQETFQAVFAAHFIEHLKDYSEVLAFMEGCRERLKASKGPLILLYPDIEKIGLFFWQDYTHSFVTSKKRIEDMLHDSGFDVVRSGRYTACFFASSGLIRLIGKVFPYFLLPKKLALFARLSFQQHAFTIGIPR